MAVKIWLANKIVNFVEANATVSFAEKETIPTPKEGEAYVAKGEDEYEPNPNEFLGEGEDLTAKVKEMLDKDPKLYGLVLTRILAILSLDRQIEGEGQEADFVREVFAGVKNFSYILHQLIKSGITCGFGVPELLWKPLEGGKWGFKDIKPRNPGKFKFGKENELLLITPDNSDGVKVEEGLYFPVLTFQGEFGNRYGSPLLQKVYHYWNMKLNSVKFWAKFEERLAVPIVVAKKGKNENNKELNERLKYFVQNLKSSTGIVVPGDVVLELLEAKQQGVINSFESFLNYLDASMAICILGQTLTSDTNKDGGAYALGQIHEKVRQDILEADIQWLENWMNDLVIKVLVDVNFPNVQEYPKWRIVKSDPVDLKVLLDVVVQLIKSGFEKIPLSWIHETFGIPVPGDNDEVLKLPAAAPQGQGKGQEGQGKIDLSEMSTYQVAEVILYLSELRKIAA